jgi:hypothetical protein
MFPRSSPGGWLNVNGNLMFSKPLSRIAIYASGSRAEQRTIFTAPQGQNTVFGAMPGPGGALAVIQVYATNMDPVPVAGFCYGDLRIGNGLGQLRLSSAALNPDSAGAPPPIPVSFPICLFAAGHSSIFNTNGAISFSDGVATLDAAGNLGLGGVGASPAARLQLGYGGALQFDRPDGTNQFRNCFIANDLNLVWTFNAGANIMKLQSDGTLIANAMITGALTASSLTVGGTPITGSGNNSAMQRIAQVVCAGSQATVDFSSIPAGFTNLMVVWQARSTSAAVGDNKMKLQINGDTTVAHYQAGQFGSHASTTNTAGTTAATAAGADIGDVPGTNSIAVASGTGSLLIPGYSGTTFVKQVMSDCVEFYINNTTGLPRVVRAFQWSVTSAINELTFSLAAGNFLDGSTFTVYGMP